MTSTPESDAPGTEESVGSVVADAAETAEPATTSEPAAVDAAAVTPAEPAAAAAEATLETPAPTESEAAVTPPEPEAAPAEPETAPVDAGQPPLTDAELVVAHDLALAALREVTPAHTIGEPAGYIVEEGGAVSLSFANTLPGYPGWYWTVSVARVEGEAPTVLEVELLPGSGALLAPEWVPWAVRLADYQAAQTALAEASDDDDDLDDIDDDDFDADDDDTDDEEEDDEDAPRRVHAGDVDGVDIDELDTDGAEELDDDAFESDAEDEEN